MVGTGDKAQESTFTKAIDDWITVVNSHNGDSEKKETAEQQAKKIRTEERVGDNVIPRMGHKRPYSSSSSENPEETQANIPPSIPSHSVSITPALSTASCSERRPPKRPRRTQQSSTTTTDDTGIRGLGTALTKYIEVLTARRQNEGGSKDIGVAERAAERAAERKVERAKDSEILDRLNRLEQSMSAILQALERREKERKRI